VETPIAFDSKELRGGVNFLRAELHSKWRVDSVEGMASHIFVVVDAEFQRPAP
jgi:hypothetical protein